jgi:hypothetical protein
MGRRCQRMQRFAVSPWHPRSLSQDNQGSSLQHPALRLNFDEAVCFIQRSANDNATSHRAEAQVGAVATMPSAKPKNKRGDKKKAARHNTDTRLSSRGAPPGPGLGGVIVDKIYSKEDWAKMTTLDKRSQVRTIRARARAQGGETRNISAVGNAENSSARNVRARAEENPARQVAGVTRRGVTRRGQPQGDNYAHPCNCVHKSNPNRTLFPCRSFVFRIGRVYCSRNFESDISVWFFG